MVYFIILVNNLFMKITRIKLLTIVDKIFITTLFTLVTFVWIKYFIRNNIYCLLVSVLISVLIVYFITLFTNERTENKTTKAETAKRINSFMYSFLLMSKTEIIKLFYEKISKKEKVRLEKSIIIFDNNEGITPCLHLNSLSIEELSKHYRNAVKLKLNKLTIITLDCKSEIEGFSKHISKIDIKILTKNETFYNVIQRYKIYPEIVVAQKSNKKDTFKSIMKKNFNRTRTKHFVSSGIIMLFFSLFFKYNLYYTITSSVLFLFAIISYFLKENTTLNN